MLNSEIQDALNKQVKIEGDSSQSYLYMASWAEINGFPGTASFFFRQAEEERYHMLKLIRYINERGGAAEIPAFNKPNDEIKTFNDLFKVFLNLEIKVTKSIEQVVDKTLNKKDYVTHNFMQWYVEEQLEEEELARTLNDKLNLVGESKSGLYLFDRDMESLQPHKE